MEFDIPIKTCLGNKTWDLSELISEVDVEDKVKDVRQEDQTRILNKSCMYKKEVNLTVKSDLFVSKQIPSVDVVWKQEDQTKILPTFCNVKVSKFEMGLCKEVNLTVKSDLFVSKQIPSVDVVWKQEDQKQILPTLCNVKVSKFEMGLCKGFCKVETCQNIQHVGCGQYKEEEKKLMDGNKKVPDKKKTSKMNKMKPSKLTKTKCGMILVLLLSVFCSLSSATKLDEHCLQTSVSGFVDIGEDLVLHCKCNCQCSINWRWTGGPNNDEMTYNQRVLQSYKDKINITQNPPGVHEYSIILKATETDFFSSDYTCHNGFATMQINRSELVQHVSSQPPPIQSAATSIMSTPEETKTSAMATHKQKTSTMSTLKQTKTSTMSTPKPPKKSNNSKMSGGKIAGIVVGLLIVVALVVGAAVFLVKSKYNPPKKKETEVTMQSTKITQE